MVFNVWLKGRPALKVTFCFAKAQISWHWLHFQRDESWSLTSILWYFKPNILNLQETQRQSSATVKAFKVHFRQTENTGRFCTEGMRYSQKIMYLKLPVVILDSRSVRRLFGSIRSSLIVGTTKGSSIRRCS